MPIDDLNALGPKMREARKKKDLTPVSYTHLDVYKRQRPYCRISLVTAISNTV